MKITVLFKNGETLCDTSFEYEYIIEMLTAMEQAEKEGEKFFILNNSVSRIEDISAIATSK